MNPQNCIDFYKADHRSQYPLGTQVVYSNFTPRSSRLAPVLDEFFDNKIVWFGLQRVIIDYLMNEWNNKFFDLPKDVACRKFKRRMDKSLGEGAVSVDGLEALHDLQYLPIQIKALPEGSRVDIKVPPFTIVNTKEEFFWITNYLETVLSCELWKPTTTATIAYEYRKILEHYAKITGTPMETVAIQAHDFSFRGMSGRHDAANSGMGHLVSFVGTDTVPAIDAVEEYYGVDSEDELIACSVPATEHSVMCMGTKEDEIGTFRRLITELYPSGIVSIVSDTWDFWKVITEYTVELKDEILNRTPNEIGLAKTVFRPDSGNPVDILCGLNKHRASEENFQAEAEAEAYLLSVHHPEGIIKINGVWRNYVIDTCEEQQPYPIILNNGEYSENEVKGAVECLWDVFGGTTTDAGYKQLHERVGLIYGDSITLARANEILKRLEAKGFASGNVVFGVGSYTYQYLTRDTFGFAMKATYGKVNGEGREIFKDPITDSGTKKSAKGLLRVEQSGDGYELHDQQDWYGEENGELDVVFSDGVLLKTESFTKIRNRLLGG